jgi:hypothetical protein
VKVEEITEAQGSKNSCALKFPSVPALHHKIQFTINKLLAPSLITHDEASLPCESFKIKFHMVRTRAKDEDI